VRNGARSVALLLLGFAWLLPVCFAQVSNGGSAASLLEEADRQKQESRFDLALAAYTAAREAARRAMDVSAEAAALQGIGDAEYLRGNYAPAKQALEASLALREQLGDSAGMGEVLNVIGNVAFAQSELPAAKDYFERSLQLRQAAGNRAGVAASWNNLGNTLQAQGLYLDAAGYLEQSERAFEELGNQRSRATVLHNLGTLYGYMGDYERALQIQEQGLEIARKLADNFRIAGALSNMGVVHNWMGNYRVALGELNEALKLRQDLNYTWGAAETLNNIGLVFQSQSDHQQSLAYFGKALALNQKLGDKSLEAESRLNMGVELLALGRMAEAVREFDQSIRLSESTGRKILVGEALRGLGRAELRLGKTSNALRDFGRAMAIQEEIGDKAGLADSTVELAAARLQLGDSSQALMLARRAAEQAAEISRRDTLWQAKLVSGQALRQTGRMKEAATDLDAAIATVEMLQLELAGPATALPAYFGDRLEAYRERVLLDLAQGDTAAALAHVERSKARALAEALRGEHPSKARWMTGEERQRERELENQLAALNIREAKASAGPSQEKPAELRGALEAKRRELESFETALYAHHPESAIQRGKMEPIQAGDLQGVARSAEAVILDYVVTRDVTYLFVLRPSGPLRMVPIHVSAVALKKKAADFRRQLSSQDLGFAVLSGELYRLLVAPAAAELASSRALIILPDGPLWDVAFQAFEPRPNHYLIEDAAISYSPSLAVLSDTLKRAGERSGGSPSLLALGDPATASAERLPEAERQVRELEKLYGENQTRIVTGAAATEELFKAEAGNYRVVHLASHAILDDASPMYSRVLLATRSAGREDGMLEAREMMDLDLRAEMVVLSACETARGEAAAGEGITGMLWAMFVAGAPTTVASLWRVESASTSELMVEFHRQWLQYRRNHAPFAKAAAMRTAALKLIATPVYSHPFYWAGFIVAGSPI
jgi:CHAT domain-containing protein